MNVPHTIHIYRYHAYTVQEVQYLVIITTHAKCIDPVPAAGAVQFIIIEEKSVKSELSWVMPSYTKMFMITENDVQYCHKYPMP